MKYSDFLILLEYVLPHFCAFTFMLSLCKMTNTTIMNYLLKFFIFVVGKSKKKMNTDTIDTCPNIGCRSSCSF